MSNNFRMIEHLAAEFYQANWQGISHIVTPSFTFKSPLQKNLNFDEFIQYISTIFSHLRISELSITSEDDIHFLIESTLEFVDNNQGIRAEMPGSANIVILDGKVDLIEIMYEEQLFNTKQFEKMIA